MTISIFTMLYIHHHYLVPEHFLTLKGNLVLIKQTLPIPPSTGPWQPLICFPSMDLRILDIS